MARDSKFLAIDFGAESGRALLGIIKDNRLELREVHRFPNGPVNVLGHLHWDVLKQFSDIKQGIKLALRETDGAIDGIGVDTWGVDFGLLGEDGELVMIPYHYRDSRTNGMMEKVFQKVPRRQIFERTGIQFMQLNTIFQLYAMVDSGSPALRCASTLLMMPDLFNYWLTGEKLSEFSIATTSMLYDPTAGGWATDLAEALGIPPHIFPPIVQPGTLIGPLHESIAAELGAGEGIPVVAPATHDTGSAVAAVPATGEGHVYLSSGTWSLMGVEVQKPLINEASYQKNYTNEGGVCGTFRFLKNIMGLWIVQECRRTWAAEGEEISYADLTAMAGESPAFKSIINPDDPLFLPPGYMPQRVQQFCKVTGQPIPETKGEIVRCILDSLALRYRATVDDLDEMFNRRHEPIHIVGGGTQNKLLSQLTADVTGRKVIAGPVEATATGNVLVQGMGRGFIESLEEVRQIVRNSFDLETYEPREVAGVEEAYSIFKQIAAQPPVG
ncbi:MAG: rhamnulokinase family protein [Armatimonadota bacterium]|nr:rhamnulokinase family protein [Armatimonadota bacterium]